MQEISCGSIVEVQGGAFEYGPVETSIGVIVDQRAECFTILFMPGTKMGKDSGAEKRYGVPGFIILILNHKLPNLRFIKQKKDISVGDKVLLFASKDVSIDKDPDQIGEVTEVSNNQITLRINGSDGWLSTKNLLIHPGELTDSTAQLTNKLRGFLS